MSSSNQIQTDMFEAAERSSNSDFLQRVSMVQANSTLNMSTADRDNLVQKLLSNYQLEKQNSSMENASPELNVGEKSDTLLTSIQPQPVKHVRFADEAGDGRLLAESMKFNTKDILQGTEPSGLRYSVGSMTTDSLQASFNAPHSRDIGARLLTLQQNQSTPHDSFQRRSLEFATDMHAGNYLKTAGQNKNTNGNSLFYNHEKNEEFVNTNTSGQISSREPVEIDYTLHQQRHGHSHYLQPDETGTPGLHQSMNAVRTVEHEMLEQMNIKTPFHRTRRNATSRRRSLDQVAQAMEEKVMAECTFQPKIFTRASSSRQEGKSIPARPPTRKRLDQLANTHLEREKRLQAVRSVGHAGW